MHATFEPLKWLNDTHLSSQKSKNTSNQTLEGFKHSKINANSPRGPKFTHNICIKTVLCSPETLDPRKSCISHAFSFYTSHGC